MNDAETGWRCYKLQPLSVDTRRAGALLGRKHDRVGRRRSRLPAKQRVIAAHDEGWQIGN
jgi:hypothetical protein